MAGSNLSILRSLIRELRLSLPKKSNLRESSVYQYIINQYRQNIVTDLQLCRERDEMVFMAQTYLTYLNSRRRLKILHEEYHGKGERSVRATANMVGFKLPHDPK